MWLYTKLDEQTDNVYEIVAINKTLSKQNFHIKILVLLPFIFVVFVNIRRIV